MNGPSAGRSATTPTPGSTCAPRSTGKRVTSSASWRRDRWVLGLAVAALAGACLVSAVVRGNVLAVLPAASLVALWAGAHAGRRRAQVHAQRWLDDPPMAARAD